MILEIFIVVIFLICMFMYVSYKLGFKKVSSKIDDFSEKLAPSGSRNIKDDAAQLLSTGSAIGIGLSFTISSFVGSNIFVGVIFLVIGIYSLKNNWYLITQ